MFQNQKIEPRIQTSAHLAQTMTMLGMSSEEIREKVESELAKNPFLEYSFTYNPFISAIEQTYIWVERNTPKKH